MTRAPTFTRLARRAALVVVTPLLEKNVLKTLAVDVSVVFSMTRLIVLAFAVVVLRRVWHDGIGGWPEATLSIAIVLALPVVGALDRVTPAEVIDLAKTLVGRFGTGAPRDVRR